MPSVSQAVRSLRTKEKKRVLIAEMVVTVDGGKAKACAVPKPLQTAEIKQEMNDCKK